MISQLFVDGAVRTHVLYEIIFCVVDSKTSADSLVVLALNLDASLGLEYERCGALKECLFRS